MIYEIAAGDNKLVKKLASLKEKKYRERYGEFLVEGALSVEWALTSAYEVRDIVVSRDFVMSEALAELTGDRKVYAVPEHIFAKIADTKTPQGILCSCTFAGRPEMPEQGLFVYCDAVRDPGNLGTIIRTADAMGFDGIILSPDCVDPTGPKLVRSTMGSLFHIALYSGVTHQELLSWQKKGFTLAASALSDKAVSSKGWQMTDKTIIIMGNESAGVSRELIEKADTVVKIPMAGSAESLNVAAAAAILMYEAAKSCHRI